MKRNKLATSVAVLAASLLVPSAFAQTSAAPAPAAPTAAVASPFELKDGDRVAFVGGTFIEREGQWGYLETLLTTRFPDRKITFRVLGQAGDTVQADARNLNAGWVNFGPTDQGFNRLKKLVEEYKPTVIIANFGMTESFAGAAKLPEFAAGYDRLLDMLTAAAGTSPRVLLLSPNYHEDLPRPYPDPKEHNAQLEQYRDAIRGIAQRRQAGFVDLFDITKKLSDKDSPRPLTDNGLHLTPAGYARLAGALADEWKLPPSKLSKEAEEKVRQLIAAKNFDYFNYWRPQNDTYILGYRKKEQGRNAVEMPQFLPLMEAKEQQIRQAVQAK